MAAAPGGRCFVDGEHRGARVAQRLALRGWAVLWEVRPTESPGMRKEHLLRAVHWSVGGAPREQVRARAEWDAARCERDRGAKRARYGPERDRWLFYVVLPPRFLRDRPLRLGNLALLALARNRFPAFRACDWRRDLPALARFEHHSLTALKSALKPRILRYVVSRGHLLGVWVTHSGNIVAPPPPPPEVPVIAELARPG